jgi:hypothetical protein
MAKHSAKAMHKASRKAVAGDLARLKGMSRADLERDDKRGAASPLGMGSHSKKEKRK